MNKIFAETHEELVVTARAEDLSPPPNKGFDLNTSSSEGNEENHSKSPQINAEKTQKKN